MLVSKGTPCFFFLRKPLSDIEVTYLPTWSSNGNISALLAICAGNSPVTGEFPAQRPVVRSFHVFFDLRLNQRSSKQTIVRRHCNDFPCSFSRQIRVRWRVITKVGIWEMLITIVSWKMWMIQMKTGRQSPLTKTTPTKITRQIQVWK